MIRVSVAIMAHPKRKRFIPELQAKLDRPATVVWDRKNGQDSAAKGGNPRLVAIPPNRADS